MMNEVPEAKAKSPKSPPVISTYSLFIKRLKTLGQYMYCITSDTQDDDVLRQDDDICEPISFTSIDIYPKIDENYRVQTTGGGVCKSHLYL